MNRALTDRERAVLYTMIDNAAGSGGDPSKITAETRSRYRAQVSQTQVSGECDCGGCVALDLAVVGVPTTNARGHVLQARVGSADLLLYVDRGRLSSLEFFSEDGQTLVGELPDPMKIIFGQDLGIA